MIFGDILIKEKNLFIEVNGPWHYLCGNTNKNLGTDNLNISIRKALGYDIVHLNAEEFDKLDKDGKTNKLNELLNRDENKEVKMATEWNYHNLNLINILRKKSLSLPCTSLIS